MKCAWTRRARGPGSARCVASIKTTSWRWSSGKAVERLAQRDMGSDLWMPASVPLSEVDQVQEILPDFEEKLIGCRGLEEPLSTLSKTLKKPLRVVWISDKSRDDPPVDAVEPLDLVHHHAAAGLI